MPVPGTRAAPAERCAGSRNTRFVGAVSRLSVNVISSVGAPIDAPLDAVARTLGLPAPQDGRAAGKTFATAAH
ncbi:hypothetical protein GCM10018780_82050 [Streptomyces lanatus]|nr:hypothetical protein GCM10018780_82050 [Streptomyces lanatus]